MPVVPPAADVPVLPVEPVEPVEPAAVPPTPPPPPEPVPEVAAVVPGVVVAVEPGVVVAVLPGVVVVVVLLPAAQTGGTVMVLASRVTAAVWAKIRPDTVAVESSVAEVSAMRVPTKVLPEPKVAELPTVQNTLQALAPFSSSTTLPDAVTRLEEA